MNATQEDFSVPVFEIDQTETYGQYLLGNRLEVVLNLRALAKQRTIATIYLDDGSHFFLSSIITVDEEKNIIFLDSSSQASTNQLATKAKQVTLSAILDRVKIQIRLPALKTAFLEGKLAFSAPLPSTMLRLQRREFFRLETPHAHPIRCKLAARNPDGLIAFDLPLFDISGGGLSLIGKIEQAGKFSLGQLFKDCRLEIPGESILLVNLRIQEILKIELPNGDHQLRLGCEFINLPGTRLTLIERYITRLERERNAREMGLA